MTDSPLSQRLIDFGATFTRTPVAPGQSYWRLVSADGPLDRGGNANIYVDALDEQGRRLADIPVHFYWADGHFDSPTELKPGEPDQGTNMNMSGGGNSYGVLIGQGVSDSLFGMGMVPFEKHKSYRVVFQRTIAGGVTTPEPPKADMPKTAREAIERAQIYLDLAKGLL